MEIRRFILGATLPTLTFIVPLIDSASRPNYKVGATGISATAYWSDGGSWYTTWLTVAVSQISTTGLYRVVLSGVNNATFQSGTTSFDNTCPIVIKITATGCDPQTIVIVDDELANPDDSWIASEAQLTSVQTQVTNLQTQVGNGFSAADTDLGIISTKVTDVKTVVDRIEIDTTAIEADTQDIQTKVNSATYGLSAIKTAVDRVEVDTTAIEADTQDIQTKVAAVKTVVDAVLVDTTAIEVDTTNIEADTQNIQSTLANATYGLAALETLVDEVETMLKSGVYGLSALKDYVDTIEASLANGTYGLSAIKTAVDGIDDTIIIELDDIQDALVTVLSHLPTTGRATTLDMSTTSTYGTTLGEAVELIRAIAKNRFKKDGDIITFFRPDNINSPMFYVQVSDTERTPF